jgi:diaminopimelate decarboxylase
VTGFQRDAQGRAILGGVPLDALLAPERGITTPAYVYDLSEISRRAHTLGAALSGRPHLVAYALKANSAGHVVRTLQQAGAGADVVSGAELLLARRSGIPPEHIVMSGVAKTDAELDLALAESILAIQAESVEEVARIAQRARAVGRSARISLRVNPSIAVDTHAHIATGHDAAKFGIALADLPAVLGRVGADTSVLSLTGISSHIGSMQRDVEDYVRAANVVCDVARLALDAGAPLRFADFGGGFAIDYGDGDVTAPTDFIHAALDVQRRRGLSELAVVIEPGRWLVGPAGVLVAQVVQSKQGAERSWLMLDAGMNDLLRPALYGARHRIEPLDRPPGGRAFRVVGPVCESTDDFGEFELGEPLPRHVVVRDAGAYGFVMSSEYNGRPLPAEVFVRDGEIVHVSHSPGAERWVEARLRA